MHHGLKATRADRQVLVARWRWRWQSSHFPSWKLTSFKMGQFSPPRIIKKGVRFLPFDRCSMRKRRLKNECKWCSTFPRKMFKNKKMGYFQNGSLVFTRLQMDALFGSTVGFSQVPATCWRRRASKRRATVSVIISNTIHS